MVTIDHLIFVGLNGLHPPVRKTLKHPKSLKPRITISPQKKDATLD